VFLSAAKWNVVRLRELNGPICCLRIKYVKSLWIRTVTRRNVTHIVRGIKKWDYAHHRQLLPVHRLRPAQIFPPATLKMRTLFSMWRVNSHNPRNGHNPPWLPKGESIGSAHITEESTPLSVLLLFFAEIITLLAVETNRYYRSTCTFLTMDLLPNLK
jgi:hypothetical protein